MISRRAFINAVAGGLPVAPPVAPAQQTKKVPRIDYLTGGSVELAKSGIGSTGLTVPAALLACADEVIQG